MKYICKNIFAVGIIVLFSGAAHALEYNAGDFGFKLSGYATGGALDYDFDNPDFVGDWRARGEVDWRANDSNKLGFVYAIDAAAVDEDKSQSRGNQRQDGRSQPQLHSEFL